MKRKSKTPEPQCNFSAPPVSAAEEYCQMMMAQHRARQEAIATLKKCTISTALIMMWLAIGFFALLWVAGAIYMTTAWIPWEEGKASIGTRLDRLERASQKTAEEQAFQTEVIKGLVNGWHEMQWEKDHPVVKPGLGGLYVWPNEYKPLWDGAITNMSDKPLWVCTNGVITITNMSVTNWVAITNRL